jgi:bifunctional oligoribonuclease and PAP phosphatase NrnA
MSKRIDIKTLSELLLSIDNVLILAHERPDGDAFGSVIALLTMFRSLGKKADSYFPEKISNRYKDYLCDGFYIETPPPAFNYSYCICLDCSNLERLAVCEEKKEEISALPMINIDHHFDNTLYGLYNYVDCNASSASEIVFDILETSDNWIVTPNAATALTMGILMDTGGFRFDNTSSAVLRKTAELMELGADYINTIKSMYFTKSMDLYHLEADIALNYLKITFNGRFAYFYMDEAILTRHNLTARDTEGLIDTIRIINGIDITAILTKKNNGFRVSMRSNNPDYAVSEIAHRLNGGGHKLAAGCFIETEGIQDAEKILIDHVDAVLKIQ